MEEHLEHVLHVSSGFCFTNEDTGGNGGALHMVLVPEVAEWCREMLQPGWHLVAGNLWDANLGGGEPFLIKDGFACLVFASAADLVFFRLRWPEETSRQAPPDCYWKVGLPNRIHWSYRIEVAATPKGSPCAAS